MKIQIITEGSWILNRCAREIEERVPYDVQINGRCESADVVYHIPYWRGDLDDAPAATIRLGFFTHGLNRAAKYVGRFSAYVAMNARMAEHLVAQGAFEDDVVVIRPGVDGTDRNPIFGVVGRTYQGGRKGEEIVEEIVEAGFDVRACGRGRWPCEITHDVDERFAFYEAIDYLLVPSLDEGGPMPVVEALAARVPIIAPDVGWCWEYPVIRYERGSVDSLIEVLDQLSNPPTWEHWGISHRLLFETFERRIAA